MFHDYDGNYALDSVSFKNLDMRVFVGHYLWMHSIKRNEICPITLERAIRVIEWFKTNSPNLFLWYFTVNNRRLRWGNERFNVVNIYVSDFGILPTRTACVTNDQNDYDFYTFAKVTNDSFSCCHKDYRKGDHTIDWPKSLLNINVKDDEQIARLEETVRFLTS